MITRFGKYLSVWLAVFCLCLFSMANSLSALAATTDDISSTGLNYPSTLAAGKGFALKGVVTSSESKIVRLEAGVYKNGKMITGRNWNPNKKSIDFKWYVNPYVEFGTLVAGSYTYKVTATNNTVKKTLLEVSFDVTPAAAVSDKLSCKGCKYPTTLIMGKGFALRGVVSSQTSKITKLQVGVFDADNKMVTGRSYNPKSKSVDIRWSINPHVKFGTLPVGTYSYRIVAANAAGEETLLNQTFTIDPAPAASDKITSSGLTAPTLLIKGRGFALKGIVSSQTSKLTNLTAGVFDGSGNMLTGRSFNPKEKSVDFRWYIDPHVKFGSLGIGTYTYKVIATNGTETSTLLEAAFEVVE